MSEDKNCFFFKSGFCDETVTSLNSFRYKAVHSTCFPGAHSAMRVLLLCDDRFYQYPVSLNSTFICSKHEKEYLKEYRLSVYKKCWLRSSLRKPSSNIAERNINPIQALTIYEKFGIRHSYGKVICSRCRQSLEVRDNMANIDRHMNIFQWVEDVSFNDDKSLDEKSDDSFDDTQIDSLSNDDIQSTLDLDKKKKRLLSEFLHLCGSTTPIKITKSFNSLQKQSKLNFLSCTRNLVHHVINFVAEFDSLDARQLLFNNENESNKAVYDRQFTPIMRGIAESYDNADNWSTRRSILSIVAPKINFSILQSFIPGITYYRFIAARRHAAESGSGALVKRPPRIVYRFEKQQVEHFVDFIISNYVCTDVPFGEETLTLSDGTKLNVPDTIRNCNSTRIIKQYFKYASELFPDLPVLQESSLFKILAACKASTRKAISGLNYFAANGSEAFNSLFELIDSLDLDKHQHNCLVNNLKRGKQYLKTDYKVNVARKSRVSDHCIQYALSDRSSSSFSISCLDHEHDQMCCECSYLAQTLQDIHHLIQQDKDERQEIERKLYKFNLAYDAIQAWKSHQLRVVNQDLGRECVLDIIGEDVVYLNLDFAMKWIPDKYREAQNDFYGKRGVTWHITVASRKKEQDSGIDTHYDSQQQQQYHNASSDDEKSSIENYDDEIDSLNNSKTDLNNFEHTVFVHVLDQCPQDGKLVVSIITDVLERLKSYDNSIQQACIRSDNAACYHSASSVLSMPTISRNTGIDIKRMDFADPQGGKGSSDRFAAIIKSHVRRYLNENHDVTNAQQFVEACLSYGGVRNVNVVECRLSPSRQSATFKLKDIKKFRNFCFERGGLRMFRAWDIGAGSFIDYNQLIYGKVNVHVLEKVQPPSSINFGSSTTTTTTNYSTSRNSTNNNDDSEYVAAHTKLFECPEETCICSHINYGNLLRHLSTGRHRNMPEKNTLLDTAKKLYHSKLTNSETKRIISMSVENFSFDSLNFDQLPQLNMGWALPVSSPPVRFSIKQKGYLDEKFNDGVLHGRYWKPETVANTMQQLKTSSGKYVFNTNEWLTTNQIRSYFSRMRTNSIKTMDLSSSFGDSQRSFTTVEYEREEDLFDEANAEESLKDDAAAQEFLERITFISEVNQETDGANQTKRPISLIQKESFRRKRSATPRNRK